MNLRGFLILSLAFLAMGVPAWAAPLEIVTTTTDLGDATRQVGGSRVRVQTIAPGYQNPHQVETRPSYLRMLQAADGFLQVGLDLEVAWSPALLRGARNQRIMPGNVGFFEPSQGIQVLEKPQGQVDRTAGDVHPMGNPHYTLSPTNMKIVARNITAFLKRMDPAGAAAYDQGYRRCWQVLDAGDKRWKAKLAPFKGAPIVTYHNTWPYFARHFGLEVVGEVEPQAGISPSPAHLERLARTMRDRKVKVIVMETWFPANLAEALARKTGARVLKLPVLPGGVPGTETYERMMDHIVDQLARAL